ncbi:MAG: ADOP family duplicated permease [Gemmatimonadetes bacterium]|nr:ADOP family duplicated permease [Gemmatimonadota bacterium]
MSPRPVPPRFAEAILAWFVPDNGFGESILGDLREEFASRAESGSRLRASQWYRVQAMQLSGRYAARALLRIFGRTRRHREDPFESKPRGETVGRVAQDVRYAVRTLIARPAFALTVIVTLALGIGANAAIFSVVNGVLLNPLPYPDADRLIGVWGRFLPESGFDFPRFSLAPPEYVDYKNDTRTMEAVAAYAAFGATLIDGDGDAERVNSASVTSNLFSLLRAPALVGRTLIAEDDHPAADPVVVLSHPLWHRRFGGAADIVGRRISVNGTRSEVVGVMPPGFSFPGNTTQLWSAMQIDETRRDNRQSHNFFAFGRLAGGATLEAAEAELEPMMARWKADFPDIHTGHFLWVEPMIENIVGTIRPALLLLLGAVGFVLLIVCANVANLLLAAGEHRRREMAVRNALGASRRRILQQLLTESAVLASIGGVLGLALAVVGTDAMIALNAGGIPRADEIGLDGRVLAFTGLLTVATSFVFGIIPAMQSASPDLQSAFKDGTTSATAGRRRMRFRQVLVVSEMALSILLVIGAGLMIKSFWALQQEDPGFQTGNTLVATLSLPSGDYDAKRASRFYTDLLEDINAIPGVERASAVTRLPLLHGRGVSDFEIEGDASNERGEFRMNAANVSARAGYFETMGIRLVRGRFFEDTDRVGTATVAIINEAMARRFWPDEDPMGQRIRFSGCDACPWAAIVGIVGDVKYQNLGTDPFPTYYFANAQVTEFAAFMTRFMALTVKTTTEPLSVAPALRAAIRRLDPNLPILALQPMTDVMAASLARPRFTMILMGIFGGVALLLGAVGIYGVMSYGVAHRTNEIGLRIALGAGSAQISRMVLGQGIRLALLGVGIGIMAAIAGTRVMGSLLFNVSTTDPAIFVAVSVLLSAIAVLASYLPARRATKVDPMAAMRSD